MHTKVEETPWPSVTRALTVRPVAARNWLLAIAAFGVVLSWALSSPVGASPDDDFHLASTWCAEGLGADGCAQGDTASERMVPQALLDAPLCFRFRPHTSAACQGDLFAESGRSVTSSARLNSESLYPPVFYRVMNLMATDHVVRSGLVMRVFNGLLVVALVGLIRRISAPRLDQALLLSWLVASVPLGVFIVASNNPSSWAVTGVGTCWAALVAMISAENERDRRLAGGLALVAAIVAAGSRADGAAYLVVSIAAVVLVTGIRASMRRQERTTYLVVAAVSALGLWSFLSSSQSHVVADGFASDGPSRSMSTLLWSNLSELRIFLYGMIGRSWGLGWLDTSMRPLVWRSVMLACVLVGFIALRRHPKRDAGPGAFVALALAAVTVIVHVKSSMLVGEGIQPRYLLPLLYLLLGIVVLGRGTERHVAPRWARLAIVALVSIANSAALHTNLRRYVTGIDVSSWNLDANREWWWPGVPSPLTVWAVGSLSMFAAALLVMSFFAPQPEAGEIEDGL